MVIKTLALLFSAIFETYYANLFYGTFMKKRLDNKKHLLFLVLLFAVQATNSLLNIQEIMLVIAIAFSLGVAFLFKGKAILKIGLACLLTVINACSEYITSTITMLVLNTGFEEISSNLLLYSVMIVISKFVVFFIILAIKVALNRFNDLYLKRKDIVLIMFLPIATILMMFMMCRTIVNSDDQILNILVVSSTILLVFANVVILEILNRQSNLVKTQIELSYAQKSLEEQKKHYQALFDSNEEIKRIRHDEKNLYTAAIASIDSGETEEVKRILSAHLQTISDNKNILNTNHPAIDAVIQSKLDICENSNIKTDFKYFYKEQILVDTIELSIIIGNLLDNSIEACNKLDSDRWINFLICVENGEINISVENSSIIPSDKSLKTSKKNKDNHGFGIKNINAISAKYNGLTSFEYGENNFMSYVSLENTSS